ncbi:MAG TPA: DUF6057 family protein, partial [Candidatus Paceibacterota bacterium]|nr:DUF6057 family protein [Candidatus Paceibacterota bacterium]
RHCEEAVLLYQRLRGKEVDLHGCQISPETRQRFQALCGFIDRGELRNADADRALARDFGDTYWSFYLTHVQAKPAENHSMMQ